MLKISPWQKLSSEEKRVSLTRPLQVNYFKTQVQSIISEVQNKEDKALLSFTSQFEGLKLNKLTIAEEEINNAVIPLKGLQALETAIGTISLYHKAMLPETINLSTAKGIRIERLFKPIPKVGLYVPGGNKTPLVSSLLMQAIPAKIAGCPIKVLCTPANKNGEIDSYLLVAARLCEINTIYPLGGAQAIAAMAYGTESVTKVDKLFGPGNRFVTEAKTQVATDPLGAAIDMPAGPSEVMILADEQANPAFIAADLLAQAEHGADSQVLLICESFDFANKVNQALAQQIQLLSRQEIIKQALAESAILVCTDREEQITIINTYAPEHLIINREDATDWVGDVVSAGTIFLGQWAAETMGDYVSGSNHVLPTNGYARSHSGLSTGDFLKAISVQSISAEGLKNLGAAAQTLAEIEGLDAHANAIALRLMSLES